MAQIKKEMIYGQIIQDIQQHPALFAGIAAAALFIVACLLFADVINNYDERRGLGNF